MKIKYIKINGFGKLKDKEIYLKDKINIIEGNNESGKSTLLKFISSMFYGVSKNKNRKEISDFEKYQPWNGDEFSGKIRYELDNGEEYEIYRDFKKKTPQIYDKNYEDISKKYNIDKNKGSEFFTEQTGVTEEVFFSTGIAEQSETKLDQSSQNAVIHKLSNLVSTGSEEISLKKAIDKLNKKQLEEIGTERSVGRPINLINKEIEKLEYEKRSFEQYEYQKYNIENEKINIEKEINESKNILNLLRDAKIEKEKNKIDQQILENKLKDIKEINIKIDNYNEEMNKLKNKKEKNQKSNKMNFITLILLATVIIASIVTKIYSLLITIPVILLGLYFYMRKQEKNNPQITEVEKYKQNIEKLRYIENEKQIEIETLKQELEGKIKKQEIILNEKYENIFSKSIIKDILSTDYEKIVEIIDEKEREITEYKISEKTMQVSNQEILNKLENLVKIDEQLNLLYNEKKELEKMNNIYNITKTTIEEAYNEIRENLTPNFIEEIKNIIEKTSESKYKKISIDNQNKLVIEVENGNYMPVERLSIGTIDLIYLSLRLSALKEITDEKMPIILDESFAYYDDKRMKNILEYIAKNYNNQILILTCTNREKEILNQLEIGYNNIRM